MVMIVATATAAVMVVFMSVVVVFTVIVVMPTAAAAVSVVDMLVGIGEGRRKPAFERGRYLAWRVPGFDYKAHNFGRQPDVVDLAQIMTAQTPLPVDNQDGRRPLQLISGHRFRRIGAVRLVLGNRKRQPVLGNKGLDRLGVLLLMIFKSGVEADHRHLVVIKVARQALRLRHPPLIRAGAMGLECNDHHHPSLERCQGWRGRGIEPSRRGEFGGGERIEHVSDLKWKPVCAPLYRDDMRLSHGQAGGLVPAHFGPD